MKTSLVPRFRGAGLALVAGLAGFAPFARAVSEPSALTGQRQSYASSWQQEVQDGAAADQQITQQMGLYDDPAVQQYVGDIGRRVLAASTFADPGTPAMYRNTKFTFRVLDSDVVNAFALPGGYVYVTRGLLAHVDNEAQLAVVLGHEIGHVAARHASQQARRARWGQLGEIAAAVLGQAVLGNRDPAIAQQVANTGGQALQVFMLRYSREDETQADTLGVGYALRAGYAAGESARFFDSLRRLAAQEGQGLPTWMSTHPDPGNRAAHVQQLVAEYRGGDRRAVIGAETYLQHINGIVVGADPRQGFVAGGEFYHPSLHFQLPVAAGWKVDNQPAAVVFTEPNGRGVMTLQVAGANRTHDAATQFVSQNNVQVSASGDTAVNGLPTSVVIGRAKTDQGEVGVWDAFIELEGKVYSLLGYGPVQTFETLRPTFESVAAGFSPLRDPRLADVQPAHLRIVRAERPAPFAAYVPTALPPQWTAESVAILNQVGLEEPVPAGAALKIPDARGAAVAPAAPAAEPTGAYPASPWPARAPVPPAGYPPVSTVPVPNPPSPQSNYPSTPPAYPPAPAGLPSPSFPSSAPSPAPYPSSTDQTPTTSPPASPSQPGYPAPQFPQPGQPATAPTFPTAQPQPTSPAPVPATGPSYPPGTPAPEVYPVPSTAPNSAPPAPNWPR